MIDFKVIGISKDFDTCTECGKTDLKKVVIIQINNVEHRMGIDCAHRFLVKNSEFKPRAKADIELNAMAINAFNTYMGKFNDAKKALTAVWNKHGVSMEVKGEILNTPWGEYQLPLRGYAI